MRTQGSYPRNRSLRFKTLEHREMLSASFDTGEVAILYRDGNPSAGSNYADVGVSNSGGAAGEVSFPRGRPTLNTEGTTFVADNGNLLRGPFASTEWGPPPPLANIQSIKQLGANAIHLYGEVFNPNYTGVPGPGDEPGYAVNRIDQMVQMTRDEGLYLVLTIGNGGNNGSFNFDYVMDFWEFYAPRYANEAHVLYEIQNEPHAWSVPYPQAALDMEADAYTLIRSLAPDTPIMLMSIAVLGTNSGPQVVADLQEISSAASVDWSNTAVAVHGYGGFQGTTASVEYILDQGFPVVMTEYTASDWGTDVDVLAVELIAELERLGVSWLTFQHIPPNFIGTAFTDSTAFYDVVNNAGLSWTPDFGDWPVARAVYGNGGQARATTGLSGSLRIEAEHFDIGKQGVAYSDVDAENQGGQLRGDEGVDIEATSDLGGGYSVGWTVDGEWLEYTIFVTESGFHDIRLRIASLSGGAARVILDGEDKIGLWTLPNTGGSQTWATVSKQVFLKYGRQKLRFEIPTGGFNLNWIELAPATGGAIPNGSYKILNRNSALALEADTTNRTVEQSQYTGASNEHWNLVHRGAGQYSITSASNNWSWNTFYDNNGEPLTLAPWGYDGHPDRRFIVAPAGDGFLKFLVADGGLSIELEGASMAVGAAAQQQEYQAESHQQWAILSPSAPSFPSGLTASWSDSIGVHGDYNSDGTAGAADYTAWRDSMGQEVPAFSAADGNGTGIIDEDDYQVWKSNFGNTTESFRIELSWTAVAGATSYNIKRSSTTGGSYATIAIGVTATSYVDVAAPGDGPFYYVVSAENASGESLNGAEVKPATLHVDLKFDEPRGNTAFDSTGNGWDGSLVNGPLRAIGINGIAIDLDGSNDHVQLPAGVVSSLTSATLATWVNLDSIDTWTRIFDFGSGTATNMFLTPRSGITNLPVFAITTSGNGGEQRISSSTAILANAWTHVAVTLSGGTGILYINGVEVGRNNGMSLTPSALGTTTQNYIGRSQYSGDGYLRGLMDEFRIYDDALTATAIANLATPPAGAGSFSLLTAGEESEASSILVSNGFADDWPVESPPNEEPRPAMNATAAIAILREPTGSIVGISRNSDDTALRAHLATRRIQEAWRTSGRFQTGEQARDDAIVELGNDSHRRFKFLDDVLVDELIGQHKLRTL